MDEKFPLGPKGPSIEQIDEWKKQHGLAKLKHLSFNKGDADELVVVYRPVKYAEFKKLQGMAEAAARTEEGIPESQKLNELLSAAVLWPKDYREGLGMKLAGVPGVVADAILQCSGFANVSAPEDI